MHRGKFIALTTYYRKEESSQINNLSFHFKIQKKNKSNERKDIVKSRTEITEIEN